MFSAAWHRDVPPRFSLQVMPAGIGARVARRVILSAGAATRLTMAIIRCPSCRERVSDKRDVCPNCGYGISDKEGGLSISEASARVSRRKKTRLQMHVYGATLVFVIGIAWMMVETGGNVTQASTASMFTTGLGIVWYVTARIVMILSNRKAKD